VQLSPEWHAVLACARTTLQSEKCQPLERAILETVNWGRLTALACRYGIAPLVYHKLHQLIDVGALLQGALDGLQRSYYGNVARHALLYKERNCILDALQGMEVRLSPSKRLPWQRWSTPIAPYEQ
jgi:hypothetical protein